MQNFGEERSCGGHRLSTAGGEDGRTTFRNVAPSHRRCPPRTDRCRAECGTYAPTASGIGASETARQASRTPIRGREVHGGRRDRAFRIKIYEEILGKQHPDYATRLNNLASIYFAQGDYARAEPLHVEAKQIREQVLGKQHPHYILSLNNLAVLHAAQGEYARAEQLHIEAKQIYDKVLGKQHPDYALNLANLAMLYTNQGDYARAEPLLVEVLRIREQVLGKQHPDYAVSLANLASLYRDQGDYARAEPLLVEALRIRKQELGKRHPAYAASLISLALLHQARGDHKRAEPLLVEGKQIIEQVVGRQHPSYATSLVGLASLYFTQGDYGRVEPLLVEAMHVLEQVRGKLHPDYAANLNNLAMLYRAQGDYARAEPLYIEALTIKEQRLGKQHPKYVANLNNLALLYQAQGDYARAEPLLMAAHRGLQAATEKAVPVMSQAQATSWMQENGPRTNLVLDTLRQKSDLDGPGAYEYVWQTKGMVSRLRVGQTLSADASAEAKRVFAELRDARLRLARFVSATPTPEQAAEFRQKLVAANERKETLEKQLAAINPASQRVLAVRDAKVDELLESLPYGVAVIDLSVSDDWEWVDNEITLKRDDGTTETARSTNQRPKKSTMPLCSDPINRSPGYRSDWRIRSIRRFGNFGRL